MGMKRLRFTWLVLVMAIALAFIFGSWLPVHHSRSARMRVERDVIDTINPAHAKTAGSRYEPYFVRVNYLGNVVLTGTKVITPGQ